MICERLWQAQAMDEGRLGPGDVAAFERHARTCSSCRRALTEAAELRSLMLALPRATTSELEARRLRARILRDAMAPRQARPHHLRVVVAGLAAALVVLMLLLRVHRQQAATSAFAGTVLPEPGAVFRQSREGDVERVELTSGGIGLHVRKQRANERFLVMVPDGEIEVRGTTFEVAVHDGRTTRVHVDDGVVIVRLGRTSTLNAGDSWPDQAPPPSTSPVASTAVWAGAPVASVASRPSSIEPSIDSRPMAAPSTITPRSTVARVEPDQPSHAEHHELPDYERAVAVYRDGRFEEAAERLHAFGLAYPSSALLDDASFLEASSLANAGRSDAAALLAERHLVRFPSSFHRKDDAILVTRLRRDRGDCEGARKAAGPWLDESPMDPRITTALGGCLGH